MCARFQGVTKLTLRVSTSDSLQRRCPQFHPADKNGQSLTWTMNASIRSDGVTPQLGEPGFFCVELFCGSGNLTFAMKHYFPDSFGVDHKVTKQRVKVVCLDLTKSDHQNLVETWLTSGRCLWVHFGIPCGTASRARMRRLNKRVHGPPPLRNSRWPDGIPGIKGVHLLKLRAANCLYSFMRRLIKKLHSMGITWTVENPLTSLLWETSYWVDVDECTSPFYCELHNCMFGGSRLKRTRLASNNNAILSLNVLCDGQHEHAAWSMTNGVFDTSLEAEYTPSSGEGLCNYDLGIDCKGVQIGKCCSGFKTTEVVAFSCHSSC